MKKLFFALALLADMTVYGAWSRVSSPTDKSLLCISFGSPLVGYIGGTDSTLLKTIDGGKTWTMMSTTGMRFVTGTDDVDITDINFINALAGYAIVSRQGDPQYQGTVYKTTDGGINWFESNASMVWRKTFFFDEHNGFVVGTGVFSGCFVSKMLADKWQAAQYISNRVSAYFLNAVDFYSKDIGITAGSGGYVFRTVDGGASWDTVKTSVSEEINDLQYLDENTIIAATENYDYPLIVSRDKGSSWESVSLGTFDYPKIKAIFRSPKDSLIVVGVSRTTGKGMIQEWKSGLISEAPYGLNAIDMVNDSIAYTVGDSGLIVTNNLISTGIPTAAPEGFMMYPNPAKASFYVSAQEEYHIQVVNLMGKMVAEPVGFAPTHTINTVDLAPGVYTVVLTGRKGQRYTALIVLE